MVRSILHRLIATALVFTILAGAVSSALAARPVTEAAAHMVAAAATGHVCAMARADARRPGRTAIPAGDAQQRLLSGAGDNPGDTAMRARCYGCNLEPSIAAGDLQREYAPAAFAAASNDAHARTPFFPLKPPRS